METILLQSIPMEDFLKTLRELIREELKVLLRHDQLLTKQGAQKITGASNAVFLRAIQEGIVKPQLIKGRKQAMYLESEVLRIPVKRRSRNYSPEA
ncbi:hypothetical protein GCM10022289_19150 [Pedobacter jeongneungensis]|uniref:DNA-binding protein n=1 Tax=Pedobacter jeongneungensis TaxID=947309 RepID=A0ABP8BC86_9SPHI